MTSRLQLQGRWVLVTGASSGLGEQLARQLATIHRAHVLLVARRVERLTARLGDGRADWLAKG